MLDAERVLPAVAAAEQAFGMHVERTRQVVDALDLEFDPAQRNEVTRSGSAARGAGDEPAVHGHRLGAVLAQVQCAQAAVASQGMVHAPVRRRAHVDRRRIPRHDVVEQAHRARVRDEPAPVVVRRRGVVRFLHGAPRSEPPIMPARCRRDPR